MNGARTFDGRQRWLFRVPPLPGESLSSVVERCAVANAVSRRQFLIHLGLRAESIDLDRLDVSAIETHEMALGYLPGALAGTTLSSHLGQTFTRMTLQGIVEWCAGQGTRSKRVDAVCAACLAAGPELYRRLHWRAAYVCRCDLHDQDLIDQCPSCRGPVPTLAEMRDLAFRPKGGRGHGADSLVWNCARCGHRWRPLESVDGNDFRVALNKTPTWRPYQAAILRAHHGHRLSQVGTDVDVEPPWFKLGCNFTFQFLAGIRALLALMHSPTAGHRLRTILAARIECDPTQLFAGGVRGQPVEVYPVTNRRLALDAMAALLDGGIDGMLLTMEQARMTSSTLLLTDRYIPNWLQEPIALYLNRTRYSHSAAEILAASSVVARSRSGPVDELLARSRDRASTVDARPLSAASTLSLSKAAVGRLLGSRDSKALDGEFGRVKRRYSRREAEQFFERAFDAVPQVPVSRTQRQVVIRTLLILLGVAVRGQTVEEVCGWHAADVRYMLRDAPRDLTRTFTATLRASEHGHAGAVLTSRFGARLRGASTRLCAARLLSQYGAEGTWNSANALAGVLAPAGTSRDAAAHQTPNDLKTSSLEPSSMNTGRGSS